MELIGKFTGCLIITEAVLWACFTICGVSKITLKIGLSSILSLVFAVGLAGFRMDSYYQWMLFGEMLALLTSAAIKDWKERIIPNALPLLVIGVKILLSICQLFSHMLTWRQLGVNLICAILCILLLWLVSRISRSGIGMGDIKLLASLGFACGAEVLWTVLLLALLICTAAVFVLLAMKKKTMKDSLPFAPFILAGYVGSLLLQII